VRMCSDRCLVRSVGGEGWERQRFRGIDNRNPLRIKYF